MQIRNRSGGVPAPAGDRRTAERTTSVYRPVLIETAEFGGFCLVKNLSPGGMMGVVYTQFSAEQPVTIQFHPDHVISGMIVWSKEGRVGIRFNTRIDVDAVLHNLASKSVGTKINRAPRLPIEYPAEIEIRGRVRPIRLLDISQRGMKAVINYAVDPGDEVVVRLDGLEPHRAEVRWVEDGLAGLNFILPIGFEDLARWVIERQSQVRD